MANQWFRMYAEFATDPKVQMMTEADQRRFIMLLCLRCSSGDVTLRDEEVAFQLRISNDEWAETKARFIDRGLITEGNEPAAWDKRQFISDSSAARVAKHRARMKSTGKPAPQNNSVTVPRPARNVTVTPPEAEAEAEAEAEVNTSSGEDVGKNPPALVLPFGGGEPAGNDAGGGCDSDDGMPACPHQAIIAAYHAELPTCPRIRDWTPARAKALRTRWREKPERQDVDWWRRLFAYCAKSAFLTGRSRPGPGRKPFTMSLDWLVKAENFAKVIEGRYEDEPLEAEA